MTAAGLVEPDLVVAGPGLADVTAVLVTAGVTPYLEATLGALGAQTRLPAVVLLVDVGGPAGAAALLDAAFVGVAGVRTARTQTVETTFGAAVDAGLAKLARAGVGDPEAQTPWLWLLHDDCAPAPTALAELVDAVGQATSVAVAGPKQRTWTDPERLVEVGLTTTRSGRRVGAAVPGELDQGQHDGLTDVLGVGTAGALVRWDVWRQVGGTDPALGPFGDGLDLSRRARLAGHRVVVAPGAVVRHARASYLGLRAPASVGRASAEGRGSEQARRSSRAASLGDGRRGAGAPVPRPVGTGPRGDPRRSLAARRRASGHARLVAAVWWAVPFVALAAVFGAPLRAVARLAAGESALAGPELAGGWGALTRPRAVWRARRRAARASVLPRRSLRPLQATWQQVWAAASERRASRAETTPRASELELTELAGRATRRRVGLAVLLVGLAAATAAARGDLVARVWAGARLAGGALAFAPSTWAQAWSAATSGWVADGLGRPGPADPLSRLLAVAALPVGGDVGVVVAVVLLGGVVLAGWGAWVAAGAATRSVALRLWAALVWALAPGLLTATGTGRVGAALAHVLLPWVAFGVARSLGVHRVDRVVSGLATVRPPSAADAAPEEPGGAVVARSGPVAESAAPVFGGRTPRRSRMALAATSLVLAAVWAGAPSLVVPSLLALVVVAWFVGRAAGRAGGPGVLRQVLRLVVVVLPGLVLLGPLLVAAARRDGGWRLLLADPGLAQVAEPAGAVHRLLGVPAAAGDLLVPSWVPAALVTWWPALSGALVLAVAVVALVRGGGAGRAVRAGWAVAVLGLGWATVLVALPVVRAADRTGPAFLGPAVALGQLGLLAGALVGVDRTAGRPGGPGGAAARRTGRRQRAVRALATLAAVAVVAAGATSWLWQGHASRPDGAGTDGSSGTQVRAVTSGVVPAVGQQAFVRGSRVLVVAPGPDHQVSEVGYDNRVVAVGPSGPLRYLLLAADGVQSVDRSVAATAADGTADGATAELTSVVAALAAGSSVDESAALGALGIAYVQVPVLAENPSTGTAAGSAASAGGADPVARARAELVGLLDATAGLERVTDGASGTLWRVVAPDSARSSTVTSWARLVPEGGDPTGAATPLAGDGRQVSTTVAAEDTDRTVLLAERAGPHWHAWLDGRRLDPVTVGWRQGFALPAGASGRLVVRGDDGADRTAWLVAQGLVVGAALLVVVVEAVPVRRRARR